MMTAVPRLVSYLNTLVFLLGKVHTLFVMSKKTKTNQEDALKVLETKLKNAELTMTNNRIVIESLVKTQGCLKDTLIEALCKLADIESDLF